MSLPPFTPSRPRDWQPNAIPPRTASVVQTTPEATLDSGELHASRGGAESKNVTACRGGCSCGKRDEHRPARD